MEKYDFSTIQLVNQRILNGTVLKIGFMKKKKEIIADEKKKIFSLMKKKIFYFIKNYYKLQHIHPEK